jgi:hypothetical protein
MSSGVVASQPAPETPREAPEQTPEHAPEQAILQTPMQQGPLTPQGPRQPEAEDSDMTWGEPEPDNEL